MILISQGGNPSLKKKKKSAERRLDLCVCSVNSSATYHLRGILFCTCNTDSGLFLSRQGNRALFQCLFFYFFRGGGVALASITRNMSQPVTLFGPTSVLGRFIIPPSPLLLPSAFCVWGEWKGYGHETSPPFVTSFVTTKFLQWPNLLLNVFRNIIVERFWTFSFGSWKLAAERAAIWLNSERPLDWNISCFCVRSLWDKGHIVSSLGF